MQEGKHHTPHLPTGVSFDSTVGERKANSWEKRKKMKRIKINYSK